MPPLNPATIALIIQGIQAAITAAPQVEALVVSAKDFIASLFKAGLISYDTQNTIHAHIDQVVAMALQGLEPLDWEVQPDPVPDSGANLAAVPQAAPPAPPRETPIKPGKGPTDSR
jgi:hypothetical protein